MEGGKMCPKIKLEMEREKMTEIRMGKMQRILFERVYFRVQGRLSLFEEGSSFAHGFDRYKSCFSSFFDEEMN